MTPEQLDADLKQAMLAKDSMRTTLLRGLKASLKNEEIALKVDKLNEQQTIAVIRREAKKRGEAAEMFAKANQQERVDAENAEKEILESYLPAQLEEAEIQKMIADAVSESGASDVKDMGKVMQLVQPKIAGRADGALVAKLVREALS